MAERHPSQMFRLLITVSPMTRIGCFRPEVVVIGVTPRLRYRVGAEATWLPRLKNAAPWTVFAAGARRRFAVDAAI